MNTKLATSRMRTGQWADIIKDCKESGLKVDDYCAQHGLSRNAYFYWLRKVKEAALTQSGFVEVRQQVWFTNSKLIDHIFNLILNAFKFKWIQMYFSISLRAFPYCFLFF